MKYLVFQQEKISSNPTKSIFEKKEVFLLIYHMEEYLLIVDNSIYLEIFRDQNVVLSKSFPHKIISNMDHDI